jgi:WD40 repeat protein
VCDIATAGTSNIVATVGKDGLLKIWTLSEAELGDRLKPLKSVNVAGAGPMLGAPRSIAFNKTLDKIVIGTYGNSLLELQVSGCNGSLQGEANSDDPGVEVSSLDVIVKGHASNVRMVACHPSQPVYASVGDDRSFLLWSSESNAMIASLRMKDMVYSIAFSPDGQFVAIGLVTGDVYIKKVSTQRAKRAQKRGERSEHKREASTRERRKA